MTISNSVDPEYLVIEPTGVGMLSNIITNLSKILYERISLGAPLTIVDGKAWMTGLRDYPELFTDQVSNAATIVISKLEQTGEEQRNNIKADIREYNHTATISSEDYHHQTDAWFNNLLLMDFDGQIHESQGRGENLDTFSLKNVGIDSPTDLLIFLENMLKGHYGNIIRAKGCVHTKTENLRFDLAGGSYTISGAEDGEQVQTVFIGRNIKRQKIREILLSDSDAVVIINKRKSDRRQSSYRPSLEINIK